MCSGFSGGKGKKKMTIFFPPFSFLLGSLEEKIPEMPFPPLGRRIKKNPANISLCPGIGI